MSLGGLVDLSDKTEADKIAFVLQSKADIVILDGLRNESNDVQMAKAVFAWTAYRRRVAVSVASM